jgi:hypothetical protein
MANYTSSEIKDCLALDKLIKEYIVRKSDLLKQKLAGGVNQSLLNETLKVFNESEDKFSRLNCRNKIEFLRLNETAVLDLEQAIKSEASVLEKNKKEQNLYIGLGAIVLLTGFYILIKK